MKNRTQENIKQKRRQRRKRRRVVFFRRLFFVVVLFTIISFIVFVSYRIFEGASYLYGEYLTAKESYIERKQNQGVDIGKLAGYTNILVMGIDEGASVEGDEGLHADTILFISMDLESGRLRIIAIPADTYIRTAEGEGRIANFYGSGGASRMVRAVSEFLRVSVHQYVVVNTAAFEDFIDALDGIDVYVEDNMDYEDQAGNISIHLKKGYQRLDGKQAANFLRYRNTALGDIGRVQRQQRFIKALYQKILQLDTVSKIPKVAEIFKNEVETSAEIFDSAHIASVIRNLSSDPPIIVTLPGEYREAEHVWNPNIEEISEKMVEFFPNMEETER